VYDVDYPDAIDTNLGSVACLTYDSTSYTAGIQFEGSFRLVNFGFPFETIVDELDRDLMMEQILIFLLGQSQSTPTPAAIPSTNPSGLSILLILLTLLIAGWTIRSRK